MTVPKVVERREGEQSNDLRKYILHDIKLLRSLGWPEFIQRRRGRGDFGDLDIEHQATRLLHYLSRRGAPVILTPPPVGPSSYSRSGHTRAAQVRL